jgi:hypothetical protein
MNPPPWLQELRNLLAITSDDARQQALKIWEQRWLVKRHAKLYLTPLELSHGEVDMLQWARERLASNLGVELVKLMGEVSISPQYTQRYGTEHGTDVRIDVTAIRREPKVDD